MTGGLPFARRSRANLDASNPCCFARAINEPMPTRLSRERSFFRYSPGDSSGLHAESTWMASTSGRTEPTAAMVRTQSGYAGRVGTSARIAATSSMEKVSLGKAVGWLKGAVPLAGRSSMAGTGRTVLAMEDEVGLKPMECLLPRGDGELEPACLLAGTGNVGAERGDALAQGCRAAGRN